MPTLVPPIKCQGIKTKLVPLINQIQLAPIKGRWIEPFCGSCVIALNLQPEQALLADTNPHVIGFYRDIQQGRITPEGVRAFLEREGTLLQQKGEAHYYDIRRRFNQEPNSLDFLFLNRACFNGVMRFNQKGEFNVPFCRKPTRFTLAYTTKIVNQIARFVRTLATCRWEFVVADFRETLQAVQPEDVVYADPPYVGRHTDYFNHWNASDDLFLRQALQRLPCRFVLSTWYSNQYRNNDTLPIWVDNQFDIITWQHFYHVGASETLRNAMTEALIANFHTGCTPVKL